MVMRPFARIDRLGQIYLLAPPRDRGMAQETRQSVGFRVRPTKGLTKGWSQPLAALLKYRRMNYEG
jgi:hypothetical protein